MGVSILTLVVAGPWRRQFATAPASTPVETPSTRPAVCRNTTDGAEPWDVLLNRKQEISCKKVMSNPLGQEHVFLWRCAWSILPLSPHVCTHKKNLVCDNLKFNSEQLHPVCTIHASGCIPLPLKVRIWIILMDIASRLPRVVEYTIMLAVPWSDSSDQSSTLITMSV